MLSKIQEFWTPGKDRWGSPSDLIISFLPSSYGWGGSSLWVLFPRVVGALGGDTVAGDGESGGWSSKEGVDGDWKA